MCVAIPMRVEALQGGAARCARAAEAGTGAGVLVDISLLEAPEALQPGDWVLVFRDEALRVVSREEAMEVENALRATAAVMAGDASEETFRAGFADLIDREPPLPPHLQRLAAENSQKE